MATGVGLLVASAWGAGSGLALAGSVCMGVVSCGLALVFNFYAFRVVLVLVNSKYPEQQQVQRLSFTIAAFSLTWIATGGIW
jgi:hypothetical protein